LARHSALPAVLILHFRRAPLVIAAMHPRDVIHRQRLSAHLWANLGAKNFRTCEEHYACACIAQRMFDALHSPLLSCWSNLCKNTVLRVTHVDEGGMT
jgi:hypothetical protein